MTDPKRARCFDKDWKYSPEAESDIRKTFARIRRQMKEADAAKQTKAAIVKSSFAKERKMA